MVVNRMETPRDSGGAHWIWTLPIKQSRQFVKCCFLTVIDKANQETVISCHQIQEVWTMSHWLNCSRIIRIVRREQPIRIAVRLVVLRSLIHKLDFTRSLSLWLKCPISYSRRGMQPSSSTTDIGKVRFYLKSVQARAQIPAELHTVRKKRILIRKYLHQRLKLLKQIR